MSPDSDGSHLPFESGGTGVPDCQPLSCSVARQLQRRGNHPLVRQRNLAVVVDSGCCLPDRLGGGTAAWRICATATNSTAWSHSPASFTPVMGAHTGPGVPGVAFHVDSVRMQLEPGLYHRGFPWHGVPRLACSPEMGVSPLDGIRCSANCSAAFPITRRQGSPGDCAACWNGGPPIRALWRGAVPI